MTPKRRCYGRGPISERLERRILLSSAIALAAEASTADATNFVAIQALRTASHAPRANPPRTLTISRTVGVGQVSDTLGATNGLTGQYFQGAAFQNLAFTRIDPSIAFSWPGTPDPAIAGRPFSVRWTGRIAVNFSRTYTFSVRGSDAARLWVNGKLIVNDWKMHGTRTDSGRIKLAAGAGITVRLDVFQSGQKPGSIQLLWASAGQKAQQIPGASLLANSAPGPTTAPAAPTTLTTAAVSSTQVHLAWGATAKATSYTIGRSTDGIRFVSICTVTAGTLSFTDTTAVAGTSYSYNLCATSAGGTSVPCMPVAVTTPPAAPGGVIAGVVSATQIDLTWGDVAGETGFEVLGSFDGGVHYSQLGLTGIGSTTFHAAGLTPSTAYLLEVIALGPGGNSSPSGPAAATTPALPVVDPPAAPEGLAAMATSASQIALTWNDVASETGFIVERSPDGISGWMAVLSTPAGVTGAIDTGLPAATPVFYRVRAVGAGGNSVPGGSASATTSGVRYAYVTDQTSYSGAAGSDVTVYLYLREYLSGGSTSVIVSDGGLSSFGVSIDRSSASLPADPSTITALAANAADFPAFSGSPFTQFTASSGTAFGAISIGSGSGIQPGNTGGAAPSVADEIYLGRLHVTIGTSGTTTFSVGAIDPINGGSTTTKSDIYDLDISQATAPAYTGVGVAASLFTVTATP